MSGELEVDRKGEGRRYQPRFPGYRHVRGKPCGVVNRGRNRYTELTMGLTHVTVAIKPVGSEKGAYESLFLVDTGATDTMVPSSELRKVGIRPTGKMSYELADGSVREYEFGPAQIEFMGEVTYGRIIFGPENIEPLLGVTALESVGILVDPTTRTLKRLPAIPLKEQILNPKQKILNKY